MACLTPDAWREYFCKKMITMTIDTVFKKKIVSHQVKEEETKQHHPSKEGNNEKMKNGKMICVEINQISNM